MPSLDPEVRKRKIERKIRKRENQRKALELAKTGLTVDQIAKALGFKNKSTASRLINGALDSIAKPLAERQRKLRIAQLESSYYRSTKLAMREDLEAKTRLAAEDRAQAAIAQLIKLEGLAAPIEHRHGGSSQAPPMQVGMINYGELADLTDEDLAEAAARVAEAARAITAAAAAPAAPAGAGAPAAAEAKDGGSAG